MAGEASHEELWKVVRNFVGDMDIPLGHPPVIPQCYSCAHYHPLEGSRGADWGVCFNPASRRSGLLSFEHMTCKEWEADA